MNVVVLFNVYFQACVNSEFSLDEVDGSLDPVFFPFQPAKIGRFVAWIEY